MLLALSLIGCAVLMLIDYSCIKIAGEADRMENERLFKNSETVNLELTEEGRESLRKLMEEIGPLDIMDDRITYLTVEHKDTGEQRRFYPEEKVMPILNAAKKLLDAYQKDTEKQLTAMRMASTSARDRQEVKRRRYIRDKEIAEYRDLFQSMRE